MTGELGDPRAFRWVEAGVSGLARAREWDATGFVELPELAADELELEVRADGAKGAAGVPAPALAALLAAADELAERPYTLRAVRQGPVEWALGVVALAVDEVALPAVDGDSIEIARPPDGDRLVLVDGEEPPEPHEPLLAAVVALLEERARARFQCYAIRADRVKGERWDVTIDPL